MLQITIPKQELFNDKTQEFISTKETTIQLEHSLVSLSKWESKWNVPFLGKGEKTIEQTLDYIKCMTITQNVNPLVYSCLTNKNIDDINNYIDAPMTATTFGQSNQPPNREIVTSEVIYYWMIALNIPMECQKWHLNRLLTLIRVCSVKNNPQKMNRADLLAHNRALNKARRKKLHTKG